MQRNSFHKSERLKSRKAIEALFRTGQSFYCHPFRLLYRRVPEKTVPVLMTVAIPRKNIKRAVDRNLLKRRTREIYRQQKQDLFKKLEHHADTSWEILFLYQYTDIIDYKTIKKAVEVLLMRLSEKIGKEE